MGVLINGNGNARIYAGQDADWFASIAGNVTCRTSVGNKMAAAAVDASTIGVSDGVIITKEGRRIQLDAGLVDLFEIPTGSAGVTNYYIIGYHLFTGTDGSQEAETFVRLMSSASETITEDTFRGGASDVYVSVARVQQVGVNLGTITPLLPELSTINQINNDLASVNTVLDSMGMDETVIKNNVPTNSWEATTFETESNAPNYLSITFIFGIRIVNKIVPESWVIFASQSTPLYIFGDSGTGSSTADRAMVCEENGKVQVYAGDNLGSPTVYISRIRFKRVPA